MCPDLVAQHGSRRDSVGLATHLPRQNMLDQPSQAELKIALPGSIPGGSGGLRVSSVERSASRVMPARQPQSGIVH